MDSGIMKPTRGTKREAPKNNGSADDSNRQRGRPRIDARDQSATERRRTQIRLAQRAYRERKETTISSLNRRVATLEGIISQMSSRFSEFENTAREFGSLGPELASELTKTLNTMTDLASRGAHEPPEPDEVEQLPSPTEKILSVREAPELPQTKAQTTVPEPAPLWGYEIDYSSTSTNLNNETTQAEVSQPIGFSVPDWTATEAMESTPAVASSYADPSLGGPIPSFWDTQNAQTSQYMPNSSLRADSAPVNAIGSQPWQFSDTDQQYRVDIPDIPIPSKDINSSNLPNELPLPRTYSWTETSFTRRLLRASLEASQRLLRRSSPHPEDINRLCRFAYCFMKHDTMLSFIESVMSRTVKDNMELWTVPFFHIGGAGLHYPRDGIDASSKPPECWANARPMGPRRDLGPKFPVRGISEYDRIAYAGVTGEWFDSNDVEQYLRTKGLFIDSTTTIIELQRPETIIAPGVDEISPATTSFQDNGSGSDSPATSLPPWDLGSAHLQSQSGSSWQFDQSNAQLATDKNPAPNMMGSNSSNCSEPALNLNMPNEFPSVEEANVKRLLDVDAFLESESSRSRNKYMVLTLVFRHCSPMHLFGTYFVLPEIRCGYRSLGCHHRCLLTD